MRGVYGVCGMCLTRGMVGDDECEWVEGFGLCFTNPVGIE